MVDPSGKEKSATGRKMKGGIMKSNVYLSEDSVAIMRSFTLTAERLIKALSEFETAQKEIAEALTKNIMFMQKLTVTNAFKGKKVFPA